MALVGSTVPAERSGGGVPLAGHIGRDDVVSRHAELARSRVAALEHRERAVHGGAEVAVLCWPAQRVAATLLGDLGRPRMLLVDHDADAVPPEAELQEWVRLPVADVDARVRLLELRAEAGRHPILDGYGRLQYQGRWVMLSLTEERLAVPLVRFFRHVVSYEELATAGWPDTAASENCRRLMMNRLRARCRVLGLALTTIRCRGYLLGEARA